MVIYYKRENMKKLENLLAAGRWQEADVETRRIMLAIAGADTRDNLLLTQEDIENFPRSHLITINRLWTHHSENRFGFSTIHRIYREVDGDYTKLAERVGWRVGDRWLNYNELTFDKTAPPGHLPVTWLVPTTFWMYWQGRFARVGWELLLSRWQTCQNSEPETNPILESIPPNPPSEGGNSGSPPCQGGFRGIDNLPRQREKRYNPEFAKLERLLAAGNWREADKETLKVLLKIISSRCEFPELSKTNIQQVPNADFKTIDRLWQQYSNGKFGFSIQKRIYREVGNSINKLALQIGWRSQNKWLRYDREFNFNLSAPEGHLPAAIFHQLGFSVSPILSLFGNGE